MQNRRTIGTHLRGNRIAGDNNRLNDNAIKVLAIVKFSPTSITREEIMEQASLSREDVERQVLLLLRLQLISNNSRFPQYPQQGWRVYTKTEKHQQIMGILRSNGYQDETSQQTREVLGGYYPTGMALEGEGTQQFRGRSYPSGRVIIEDLDYKDETIELLKKWRDEKKPFRPKEYSLDAVRQKKMKFQWLSDKLSDIYRIRRPIIRVGRMTKETWEEQGSSGSSNYMRASHTITINGKFSVITFLHEYAHARGFDEVDAVIWSTNLFKRTFPVSYSRLQNSGHVLFQEDRETHFEL